MEQKGTGILPGFHKGGYIKFVGTVHIVGIGNMGAVQVQMLIKSLQTCPCHISATPAYSPGNQYP